jgi:hypothetical protein
VRDGLGPYLAIYLLTIQKWDEASIGLVMSIGGVAGLLAQTPAGALVDRSHARRAILVTAAVLVTLGALALPLFSGFTIVAVLNAVTAMSGSLFAPAIAAITLGMVGPQAFAKRIGRNERSTRQCTPLRLLRRPPFFGPMVVFWRCPCWRWRASSRPCDSAEAIDNDVARGLGLERAPSTRLRLRCCWPPRRC